MGNVALRTNHEQRFAYHPFLRATMEYINGHLTPYATFRACVRQFERWVNRFQPIASLLRDLRPDCLVLPNPFGTWETVYMVHARDLHPGRLSDAQLGQHHLQRYPTDDA